MANLIQATVYQIDGSPLPSAITLDFQTSNLVIREATVTGFAEINSAILYYNVPNNQLSVQTFYVGELLADLVDAANVGSTTQLQATVLEINEDPQVPGGIQYSFPANEILVGESVNAVTGVNSYIQFKNVRYFVSELQADLLVSGNGASAYKVYTALLTQSGGYNISYTENVSNGGTQYIVKGVSYKIDVNSENVDFSSIGALSNAVGTYFVATETKVNTDFPDSTWALEYNTGAPVATVLENTIGNIWFTYDDIGQYSVNSNGLFTENKTITSFLSVFPTRMSFDENILVNFERTNDFELTMYIGGNSFLSAPIEIRVYN